DLHHLTGIDPSGHLVAEVVARRLEPCHELPVDRVPGAEPVGVPPVVDDLALTIQVPNVTGGDADAVERDGGPLDEITRALREEPDTCPPLDQRGWGSLVDVDLDPEVSQQQPHVEPPERSPDDRRAHGTRRSGLAEGRHLVDRALEEDASLVARWV